MGNEDERHGFTKKQKVALVLAGALLALTLPLVVTALTDLYHVGAETHYKATDGPEVVLGESIESDALQPFPDENTIKLSPHGTISSNGDTNVRVDTFGDDDEWTRLTEIDAADNELIVDLDDRNQISVEGGIETIEYDEIVVDEGHVLSVQTDGSATITVDDLDTDGGQVAVIDADTDELMEVTSVNDGSITFDVSNDRDLRLVSPDDGPTIDRDSAHPVGPQSTVQDELRVNVSDHINGDVDVEFFLNGDSVGTETISDGDGQATVSISEDAGGDQDWEVVATDEFGDSTTETFEYALPSELEVRDEESQELLTDENLTIEVQFFERDGDSVFTREAENGVVDLEGLPVDTEMIVVAQSNETITRRILLKSITEQSSIYLLNESTDAVLTEFEIDDRTNEFPNEESKLIVQKALNDSDGDQSFKTIAGDEFGANGVVPVWLERDQRYRIVVENDDGDQRVLGTYIAEREQIVDLQIGTVSLEAPEDRGYAFQAKIADPDEYGENVARITYVDDGESTSELTYFVHEVGNESNVVHGPVTISDPSSHSELVDLPENGTWAVTWEAERNGETIGETVPVGNVGDLGLPGSGTLWQTIGFLAVLLIAGLFGGSMSRTGAVVVVVFAWAMTWLGVLVIPYPLLLAAGVVALLFKVGDASGGGIPT